MCRFSFVVLTRRGPQIDWRRENSRTVMESAEEHERGDVSWKNSLVHALTFGA